MKGISFLGKGHGKIIFIPKANRTLVHFDLKNLKPHSIHGIHIHEYGDLSDGCRSLGGHYNPSKAFHGSFFVDGYNHHHGDLINNVKADENGNVHFSYLDPLIKVHELFGRSVVLHQKADDYGLGNTKSSLLTGNAGERLDCGIIGRME